MSSDPLPTDLPAASPLRSHKDLWTSLLVYKANLRPIAAVDSPPLLYHNDLTASVPRFYSSEEMGHALWLRLHFENTHRHSGGVM
jgi:hypothetical protein